MTAYPHLLSMLTLGPFTLQSRVLKGAMHTGLEERSDWTQAARFYARRAEGGAGLIVTGGMAPDPEGGVFPGASGLYDAQDIANHGQIAKAVHNAVVLANGVRPRRLGLPGGEDAPDCAEVLAGSTLSRRIAVIGGRDRL